MAAKSKRMKYLAEQVDKAGSLNLSGAVDCLKGLEESLPNTIKPCRYDQTVQMAVRLGVDPRQADQIVRGSIVLPHGIGKTQTVLVFAQGDNAAAAEEAGADFVGAKDLADKVKDGWTGFDVAIATPDMMGLVGPLGRVLGPRGLMPSPRAGTVTTDVATTVKDYKAGKVEFRCDNAGNVHCVIGKISFSNDQLRDNASALLEFINQLRPTAAKGVYVRNVALSASKSPGIQVSV
ncbi:50S ribosomal protein L1 [Polystyrenella longa]|uniref:Large ribosomal subunit protein uL1 n=1 Tax=Polystyrenella longa TaxID=2528007 RepID=A0A518CRB9_9PLAN|nr:50S ribosomal protein L1 [Polystyrenella longa]QDU81758.1 50S ribosomal protein L1 [Polystyrenella longa]